MTSSSLLPGSATAISVVPPEWGLALGDRQQMTLLPQLWLPHCSISSILKLVSAEKFKQYLRENNTEQTALLEKQLVNYTGWSEKPF